MNAREHVVLLRSAREGDPYERVFREAGFEVRCRPVLAFDFVRQEELRGRLARPGDYGGLVCTSPRAVEALTEALCWLPEQVGAWSTRPAFAVGPRTAEALRELGLAPVGEDAGDAKALAVLITRSSYDHPLLFLSGNRRRDVLPDALVQAGVAFDELCVYETGLRTELDFRDTHVDWLVFFSPSGVAAMRQARGLAWSAVRCAAIGPTTGAALREAGHRVDAVAEAPEAEALVKAVEEA